ncbi:hypothetical protein [Corynebacterium liangguodongii]|uniref:hypothetical protein n=1 Tax=Corynebacterium liangguodongii TaxID=2079535 RepID=UPI0011B1E286|nr:hypothetical protein [Corynebacterium liangguodongii]
MKTLEWVTQVDLALRGNARAFGAVAHGRVYRSGKLGPEEIVDIGGIAVTIGIRALFDTYRYYGRLDALVAIESARHLHGFTAEDLLARAEGLPRSKGIVGFRELVGYSAGTSESPLETLGRDGIVRAIASGALDRVTSVESQVERTIRSEWGEPRRARIDAMLNGFVGIEFDGKSKLSGKFGAPTALTADERWREKQLQNVGMVICRFGWKEVVSGEYVRTIAGLIARFPAPRVA